jgi:hypothetical protein
LGWCLLVQFSRFNQYSHFTDEQTTHGFIAVFYVFFPSALPPNQITL